MSAKNLMRAAAMLIPFSLFLAIPICTSGRKLRRGKKLIRWQHGATLVAGPKAASKAVTTASRKSSIKL